MAGFSELKLVIAAANPSRLERHSYWRGPEELLRSAKSNSNELIAAKGMGEILSAVSENSKNWFVAMEFVDHCEAMKRPVAEEVATPIFSKSAARVKVAKEMFVASTVAFVCPSKLREPL
jgi:hypothetical protein